MNIKTKTKVLEIVKVITDAPLQDSMKMVVQLWATGFWYGVMMGAGIMGAIMLLGRIL